MNSEISTAIESVIPALTSVDMVALESAFDRSGMDTSRFAESVLVPVLDIIGDRWEKG